MSILQFIQTSPDELADLISAEIRNHLQDFKKELLSEKANDELLTRKETCEFLKIDSSTLWAWTKKGRIPSYGIANRRYYKRSELIESLLPVKTEQP